MVIVSRNNPQVKKILSLKEKKFRRASGLYLVEGIKQVREEVSAGYPEYKGAEYNEIDPLTSRRTMCLIPADELILNEKLIQNEY